MLFHRASLRNIALSSIILVAIAGFVCAENSDVSLVVSAEVSKSYFVGYRVGLVATIHSVTVSGRLENASSDSGNQSQDISIYYKNASSRYPLHNISDWEFVSNASTNSAGYFTYIWIPPVITFINPEEHEVVYQIKAVWEHSGLEALDIADISISHLEYESPPLMFYFTEPIVYTAALLSGAVLLSIFIFNLFSGTNKTTEKSTFDKKVPLYLVLFLSLSLALSYALFTFPQILPFLYLVNALIPIILLVSIPRFFHYLRKGNKLKTVISFVVVAWSAFLVLLFLSTLTPSWRLIFAFFSHSRASTSIHALLMVYTSVSASVIIALFLLLFFLKEERTDPAI